MSERSVHRRPHRPSRLRKIVWLSLVALLLLGTVPATAADENAAADLAALVPETMRQSQMTGRMSMVWWLPEEFWRLSVAQAGGLTEEALEGFLEVLRPYTMFVIVDAKVGPMGGMTYADPESLRERVALIDRSGLRYAPLSDEEISADARNLISMMRPVLANMLGSVGENMTFFCFVDADEEGRPLAVAASEGQFSVEVGDESFAWKTPLSSVIPAKICPVDGEELSGTWSYCPWHGKKLREAAEAAPTKP